jgi:hypothetical protein
MAPTIVENVISPADDVGMLPLVAFPLGANISHT